MPRNVVIEEFHVTLLVPRRLSVKEVSAIRRTLRSRSFEQRFRRAIQDVVASGPHLEVVVVKISR